MTKLNILRTRTHHDHIIGKITLALTGPVSVCIAHTVRLNHNETTFLQMTGNARDIRSQATNVLVNLPPHSRV